MGMVTDQDDECFLNDADTGFAANWHDELSHCPFCGADATPNIDGGYGFAECTNSGRTFWVEL